ncbi:MAG: methyltransferase family protein [Aggregatilineales bacterium]
MNNRQTFALGLVVVQFTLLGALAISLLLLPPDYVLWAQQLGFVAVFVGITIAALAIFTHLNINRALVSVSPEPNPQLKLVKTGLYRCIRHPIYLGVMLAAGGAALAHGHIVGLFLALALVGFFGLKAQFEENWLMRVYPDYAEYRAHTRRFLPALRRCSGARGARS